MESDTTSHLRPSLLTSFLSRGNRPRSAATSPTGAESPQTTPSNGLQPINVGNNNVNGRRRAQGGGSSVPPATATTAVPATSLPAMPAPTATSFTQMLRRRRSGNGALNHAASNNAAGPTSAVAPPPAANNGHSSSSNANTTTTTPAQLGPAHRIRLVPHLENSRALHFDPITRECREGGPAIRIGRFTDRSGTLAASTNSLTGKIAFKSKVVSRGHAELWCETSGKFYVKDTSSSSGTFLNHIRLSSAGVESRPHLLKDGDILQLGVDYQGGTEEIYRCVKIRVEIGREWQAGPNPFNTSAMAQLKALSNLPTPASAPAGASSAPKSKVKKSAVSDCCICLFPVTVCQALFIAPCSHSFHYKCIRTTLFEHHPGFSCPLCRSFHNLEADVEIDLPEEDDEWEELPGAETNEVGEANAPRSNAHGDEEHDALAIAQDGLEAMEISDGNAGRRSTDDEEDIPLGFQTAAEHNDRRLLPQSANQSHSHLGQTLTQSATVTQHQQPQQALSNSAVLPSLPPPPTAPASRRQPRRGTMVQGSPSHGPTTAADDIDHGFETDTGVVAFGGETDMDVDEPRHHHGNHTLGGHARTGSGRGRSNMYGNQTSNAGSSSPFTGSAPNLNRPGSAMGHALSSATHSPSPSGGTPAVAPYHSPPVRSNTNNSGTGPSINSTHHLQHGMAISSSNPGAPRAPASGSLPGSSTSHLLGDGGVHVGNGGDKGEESLSLEDHAADGGVVASGMGPFGSKRRR